MTAMRVRPEPPQVSPPLLPNAGQLGIARPLRVEIRRLRPDWNLSEPPSERDGHLPWPLDSSFCSLGDAWPFPQESRLSRIILPITDALRRARTCRYGCKQWIPAFAGMTRFSERLPSGQGRRPCAGPALEYPVGFPVHAVTLDLDLDDTIWPIGPVRACRKRAGRVLARQKQLS